jgi:HSP20 family protein
MLTRNLTSDPFAELFRLQDQLFRTRGAFTGEKLDRPAGFVPAVDVYERDEKLLFDVELPGVGADDVELEVEKGVLTVKGERKSERKSEDEGTMRLERSWGAFTRAFKLPDTVDPDSAHADMKDGVLTISFDKRAENKPRKIAINGKTLEA